MSNLGQADGPSLPEEAYVVGNHVAPMETESMVYQQATSFATGSNAGGYVLSAIEIASNVAASDVPVVTIRANASGSPSDDVLYTLTNPDVSAITFQFTQGSRTFTAPADSTLDSSTTYWVVFDDDTPTGNNHPKYHVRNTTTDDEDDGGQTGWSIGNGNARKIADGDWTSQDNPLKIKVTGSVTTGTPEGVTVSETTLTVTEESATTETYTVVLDAVPGEDVTVTPSVPEGSPVSIMPTAVTFTTQNWEDEQEFTVTGTADDDLVANIVTISHAVSGYGSVTSAAQVVVTVNDNDTANVSVSTDMLTVSEESSGTYTLVLDHQPNGDVTITVAQPTGSVNTDVTIDTDIDTTGNQDSLTFTSMNWSAAQTVTVNAADDPDPDNDSATIEHTVSGANYASATADSVTVTVTDNDTAGVSVDPTTLTIEEGRNGTYDVKLNTLPTGNVTVSPSVPNGSGVTLSTDELMFTTTNWSMGQTVTVTTSHDNDLADDEVEVSHNVSDYTGVTTVDSVTVTITDDDEAGVTILPASLAITVPEGSTEDDAITGGKYSVQLDFQPSENVDVAITGPTGSDLTISATSLRFTPDNWSTPQEVTVTAAEDDDSNNDTATITHTVTSDDSNYQGADAASVAVTVDDDDTDGVTISPTTLTLTEATGTDNSKDYTVELDTVPTRDVTVVLTVGVGSGVAVSGPTLDDMNRLTFTTGNWSTKQPVTVTATDDDDGFNNSGMITHAVSGYGGVTTASSVSVSVDDDEDPGVVLTDTTFVNDVHSETVTEGLTASYKIQLASRPVNPTTGADASATVTITAPTGLTTMPASIVFDKDNWNEEQTVTITAGEDDDGVLSRFTITHGVTGADYGNVNAPSLQVGVQDNDTAGLDVSTSSLEIAEGGTDTFTVRLTTQPTAPVSLTLDQPANTDVTVSGTTLDSMNRLTFNSGNWNSTQTVTVSVDQDADAANDSATISYATTADSAAEYATNMSGSISVTVDDDETADVTPSVAMLTVAEGSNATYRISLTAPPTANVTVDFAVARMNSDVSINPSSLTFTPTDYQNKQVMINASEDDDGNHDAERIEHTVSMTGGAQEYDGFDVDVVQVTVTDNDTPAVIISKSSFTITEQGDAESYTVRLDTDPIGRVEITPGSTTPPRDHSNPDIGWRNADDQSFTRLVFTQDDWNIEQTVNVRDFGDPDARDDNVIITHQVTGYSDANGDPVTASSITVTVDDNDTARTILTIDEDDRDEDGNLLVTEGDAGGTTFMVRFATQPVNNRGTAFAGLFRATTPERLTATPDRLTNSHLDYFLNMPIKITAGEDVNVVDEILTITFNSGYGDYDRVSTPDMKVKIVDDDTPSITIPTTTITDLDEEGPAKTYLLAPRWQPSGDYMVNITSDNSGVTVSPSTVTFNASNYLSGRNITVTAISDEDAFDQVATISHEVVMTAGEQEHHGIDVDSVTVMVDDNDVQRVLAAPPTVNINEPDTGTSTETYTVTLATLPVDSNGDPDSVTVTIVDPSSPSDISASPATVTLNSGNWNTGVDVTISVAPDDDTQADSGTITHTATGADYGSAGADSVVVSVVDTDTPNVLITPSNVSVTEGASDGTYTVVLSTQPATNVTVTPTSSNSEVTFSPADLTFTGGTTGNWNMTQTITVSAVEDADADADTGTITHTSTGADYGGLSITTVNVTVIENDTLDIDVLPLDITIEEVDEGSGTEEYNVTVHAAPTGGNLTIQITLSGDTNVTTTPGSLTFSASEWTTPTQASVTKTVTINVSDDLDAVDDSATLTHTIGGSSDYATEAITADPVAITITDTDTQAVRILNDAEDQEIDTITVSENSTATYKIVLDTEPTGNVTIDITDPTDSVVSSVPGELIFTTNDWDDPQPVTVTGGPDLDANEDTGIITHSVTGADYGDENVTADSVTVTVTDINIRGVEISTTDDPYLMGEGESITYQVRLETEPNGTVTITPVSTNGDLLFDPTSVTFDENDWNAFKTIEVTAGQDDTADAEIATVTHTVSGADYGANNVEVTDTVNLDIADDDQAEVRVSVTELSIVEGTSGAYTIVLGSRPVGGNVTITLTPPSNTDITIDETELIFTADNWNEAETITVSANDDPDTRLDTGTIQHTVSGANFGDAEIPDIPVTVEEDDMTEITIGPASVLIGEGGSATYTVVLETEPSGDVTVQASSDNSDVNPSPAQLTFTSTDWNEPQTVTISAASDDDGANETAFITHSASGNEYAALAGPTVSTLVVEDGDDIEDTSSFLTSSSCDNKLTLTWNAPVPIDAPEITSYQIQWKTGDASYDATNLATASADATGYTLGALNNGVSYDVRVMALDDGGGPLWLREITAMPSDVSCIAEVRFGNILADSTPVIVEVEDPEPGTQVNMRYRSLNPGVWSEVQSQALEPGDTSATFEIRGLNPSSNYEVQAWLGSSTTPPRIDIPTAAPQTSLSQVVFTSGHAPAGTTFSGGSKGGRILRIEPSIRAVTVSGGDEVVLSVEVYGRQEIHDNGLADKDPADDRPVFTWSSERDGVFREADIRHEWRNGFADDRTVSFTAPRRSGTYEVKASLDGALACLAATDDETSADQTERCSARIEVTVRPRAAISQTTTAPVNPLGTIPETLTDTDGVAHAVFTPVDGGSFKGDGYSITTGSGAVANGEFVGISMAPVGDASNVGKTWHRYTLGGLDYSIGVVDANGDAVSGYSLGSAATACVPLPVELRSNITDLVLVATDGEGASTVLSTRVRLTADGPVVCGELSSLPANIAVGKEGSPKELPIVEPEIEEELPDTGGAELGVYLLMALLLAGTVTAITGKMIAGAERDPYAQPGDHGAMDLGFIAKESRNRIRSQDSVPGSSAGKRPNLPFDSAR